MAKLNKTNSGLIFHDDFSEQTLMWTLSPSDANCLAFGENGLQIKHTKHYVTYTIVEPNLEEYSCIVHLEHFPINRNDIAGILVMSNNKEYAECQSYLATGPSEIVNSEHYRNDVIKLIHDILNEDYVLWSENEEEPTSITPGVKDEIEDALSFVDVNYPYIKFTKLKYKYIFWASEDGETWIEIGNVKFSNSGVIGFFVYGSFEKEILEKGNFTVKSIDLYTSKYITIDGIDRTYDCEIIDRHGHIIMRTDTISYAYMLSRSSKQILMNTTTIPMPLEGAKLRMYPKREYENTIAEFPMGEKVFGGDGFILERNISLFINNTEINPLEMFDLGEFYCGSYYIKVDVRNNEDYIIGDVKIKVIRYSEYYGGEEEVGVAIYHEGFLPPQDLKYEKEIMIDSIAPSESRSFFMKLTDMPVNDFFMTAHDYRFKIVIE